VTERRTVADVGEHELIARVRARVAPPPAWVLLGIGDDAAIVLPERSTADVITTDAIVEGVHFDRAFVPPADIGARALAVNLSDLAAMGAVPRVAVVSFGLPATLPLADYDALVSGLAELAAREHVAIVGGNITRSPGPLFVDVTAIGAVHPRKALTRGGGQAGDGLYVTGCPGGAAAGLAALQRHDAGATADADLADAVARYRCPVARVRLGVLVARNRAASACIDLSDGLADAVHQLAVASGTGAVIDAGTVPWHPAVARLWPRSDEARLRALSGGDDYELLFAVPPRRRRAFEAVAIRPGGLPVTRIGRLTPDARLLLDLDGQQVPLPSGYSHFAAAPPEKEPGCC
jgi:thiamine-monophosphate kinase